MATVIRKRPVDVILHPVDFTGYVPDGRELSVVTAEVVGEEDSALAVDSVTISGLQAIVRLSGGTSEAIYQVYVTAQMGVVA